MDDATITRKCAEAMGLKSYMSNGRLHHKLSETETYGALYDPLHDAAQAFALVERFPATCLAAMTRAISDGTDLKRAICLAVAKGA
jgi:hypothetical protein